MIFFQPISYGVVLLVFGLVSLGPVTQSLGLGLGLEHLSLDNKCGIYIVSLRNRVLCVQYVCPLHAQKPLATGPKVFNRKHSLETFSASSCCNKD